MTDAQRNGDVRCRSAPGQRNSETRTPTASQSGIRIGRSEAQELVTERELRAARSGRRQRGQIGVNRLVTFSV
jgi:hypothetical protein